MRTLVKVLVSAGILCSMFSSVAYARVTRRILEPIGSCIERGTCTYPTPPPPRGPVPQPPTPPRPRP